LLLTSVLSSDSDVREAGPSASRSIPATAAWHADFEQGDFSEWSIAERRDGGTFYAAAASSEGIPTLSSNAVARFEVTRSQRAAGLKHSKLYKQWYLRPPDSGRSDDLGRPLERLPNNSAGGVYRAWYYLPRDYRASRDWANVFQFKQSYVDAGGRWHQDPRWWVNLTRADSWRRADRGRIRGAAGGAPVLAVANWGDGAETARPVARAPRGRWFEIAANLQPGKRIDWFLDGEWIETSSHRVHPVGPGRSTTGWTLGVGHYGGVGKLWVDAVSFTPRALLDR
jgi:hypothetical protein